MDIIASTGSLCPLDIMKKSEENRSLSDKFMLRMPDGLRERIKRTASENNQSMNSAILTALESAFPPPDPQLEDIIHELDSIVGTLLTDPDEDEVGAAAEDLMTLSIDILDLEKRLKKLR